MHWLGFIAFGLAESHVSLAYCNIESSANMPKVRTRTWSFCKYRALKFASSVSTCK